METIIMAWINFISDIDDMDDITHFGAQAIKAEKEHPGKAHVTNEVFMDGTICSVVWVGDTPPTKNDFINAGG